MPEQLLLIASHKLFISSLLIIAALVTRYVWIKRIRATVEILSDDQRRNIARIKNGAVTVILFGLFLIWLPELEKFALSIAAFVVAIVIATKELILCVGGTVMRASTRAYAAGDWIEIGGYRGEVIDYNLLSTQLLEIGPDHNSYEFTGKTITLPNSLLLSHAVKNMNFMRRYVFHTFTMVIEPEINAVQAKTYILDRTKAHAGAFVEVARRYNRLIEQHSGIDIPGAEPQVRIGTNDTAKMEFTVRIFCPAHEAMVFEQQVTADFMAYYDEQRKKD